MSKSYDNTIALWLPPAQLRKQINRIVTNLQVPGEAKNPDESHVYTLYQAFATPQQSAAMRQAFADGIAWGEAKQQLFELIDCHLHEARDRYNALQAHPERVEQVLLAGASRARAVSQPFIRELRQAAGLRPLVAVSTEAPAVASTAKPKGVKRARIVEFRDGSGNYQFRLLGSTGSLLLTSVVVADSAALAQLKSLLHRAKLVPVDDPALTRALDGERLLAEGQGGLAAIEQALQELLEIT
jgi:tryptophanyl-tRNA synthetase